MDMKLTTSEESNLPLMDWNSFGFFFLGFGKYEVGPGDSFYWAR